ncbi:hypothetical protein [Levilactobacillus parabrevis]|nr:hypothetical protein [Levilactobacillus parabrevis]
MTDKMQRSHPWLNGSFSDIDFRSEMKDIGNFERKEPIGKEKIN